MSTLEKIDKAYYEKPKTNRTWSGFELKEIYKPKDVEGIAYDKDISDAGEYPFTRGVFSNMYRGRLWTRREVTGFGTPSDTNQRLKFQVREGASGLSIIPDLPTSMGIDVDHPLAKGDVGVCGVPMDSLHDMEQLLEGIPLDKVSTSFNESSCSCPVTMAQYIIVSENQGVAQAKLRGTMQNDPLHGRYCGFRPNSPVDLSLKLAVDIIEYCTKHMPLWNTGNVNLYDLRETGINAPQEIAFGFALATAYMETAINRGLDVDDFAPRRAFFCSTHMDFFEEIAKLRAARRMWARIMKDKYGAKNPKSWMFRFGGQTSGCALVPQQPLNNVVRVAFQGLAAILGGIQSLACCSYDEPIALPTEEAQRLALRTQEIIAHELGVTNVADPLGGSYYIESLTNKIEEEAASILKEIEAVGGTIEALKSGWFDQEIETAALKRQKEVDSGERVVVGVNAYVGADEEKTPLGVHRTRSEAEGIQIESVKNLKETRDKTRASEALERLYDEAGKGDNNNLMPWIMDACKAYTTIGEIIGTIRQANGLSYDPLDVLSSSVS